MLLMLTMLWHCWGCCLGMQEMLACRCCWHADAGIASPALPWGVAACASAISPCAAGRVEPRKGAGARHDDCRLTKTGIALQFGGRITPFLL